MVPVPRHKRPTFNQQVAAGKKAAIASDPDAYLSRTPSWRLGLLELCPPYGWHELALDIASSIQARLRSFESMTWREILYPSGVRKGPNHFMPVSELCGEAQERLAIIAPDVDHVMSLRISRLGRVWGIMDEEICQLVFWDPRHLLYEMNPADN